MRLVALIGMVVALAAVGDARAASPATCGPDDRPEPALQGQVPKAVQGEESRKGYWCGMRVVGHSDILRRGANYGLAWSGDCAYVSSAFASTSDPAGVAVIDASNPRSPEVGAILTGPASLDAVEALHAVDAPGRRVLVVGAYDKAPTGALEIYDTSDCASPKLRATWQLPAPVHNLTISADGRHVYVATGIAGPPEMVVVDISDMSAPRVLAEVDMNTLVARGARPTPAGLHRIEVSPDGKRAYAGVTTASLFAPPAKQIFQGGEIMILDTSKIAEGKLSYISHFQNGWHGPRWFRTGGRTYIVGGDEMNPAVNGPGSCEGVWPYIGDITDEKAPKPVGEFRMEVQKTEHCPEAIEDELMYATHYSDIDVPRDAALGLFPMYSSGLRIADIRDPARPREVGYFNPPPDPGTQFGSTVGPDNPDVELTPSNVRYHEPTGHIWFAAMTGGFWIVELASGPKRDLGLPPAPSTSPAGPGAPAPCSRSLTIKVTGPRGQRLRSARIYVNGRRVRSLRGRSLRVPVKLTRLPRGKVKVRIVTRTRAGKRHVRSRSYRICG